MFIMFDNFNQTFVNSYVVIFYFLFFDKLYTYTNKLKFKIDKRGHFAKSV